MAEEKIGAAEEVSNAFGDLVPKQTSAPTSEQAVSDTFGDLVSNQQVSGSAKQAVSSAFGDLVPKDSAVSVIKDSAKSLVKAMNPAQQVADKNLLEGALAGVKLVSDLNAKGSGTALKYYAKAQNAIKAGLGNITNSALGTEEFQPLSAAGQAFMSDDHVGADTIVRPIMQSIEDKLASGAPIAAGFEEGLSTATPMGALLGNIPGDVKFDGIHTPDNYNEFLNKTVPATNLLKDVPEEVTFDDATEGISQAAEVTVDMLTDPVLAAMGLPYKGITKAAKMRGLVNVAKSALKSSLKIMPKSMVDNITWAFSNTAGRPEELLKLLWKYNNAENKAVAQAAESMEALSKGLNKQQRLLMGQQFRGEDVAEALGPDLTNRVKQVRELMDNLGRTYAKEGFIKEETFFKNVGKYMPRMYEKKEFAELVVKHKVDVTKTPKIYGHHTKKRKDLSLEERQALGEILEPAYPVGKAMQQISHDLNVHNLFNGISKNADFVSDVAKEGHTLVTTKSGVGKALDVRTWGALEGKYVNDKVLREMKQLYSIPSKAGRLYKKALSTYKMAKILPNPATHTRNIIGSTIMYDMSPSSANGIKGVTDALYDMANKGKFFKEVQDIRGWNSSFFKAELEAQAKLLHGGDTMDLLTKPMEGVFDTLKRKGAKVAGDIISKLGDVYSAEDNVYKLAHYMYARKNLNLGMDDALRYMDKWGFNYADTAPATKFLRDTTTPFITYQAKALPRIMETIAKNPAKIYKYPVMFNGIERMSMRVHGMDDQDLASLKKSAKGMSILLPYTDSQGNPLLFDVTYMLPWGDLQESSGTFGLPSSLSISNPLVTLPMQLALNKNIYLNNEIFSDITPEGQPDWGSHKTYEQGFDFLYKALMPTVMPGGYSFQKVEKALAKGPKHLSSQGMPYDPVRVFGDVLFGLKTRGVNVDKQKLFNVFRTKGFVEDNTKQIRKLAFNQSLTEAEKVKDTKHYVDRIIEHLSEQRDEVIQ